MAVAHAALGNHIVGEMLHIAHFAFQHGDLQTVVVTDMHMQRGDRKLVMVMLCGDKAARQIALFMLVNVGEYGIACCSLFCVDSCVSALRRISRSASERLL